MRRYERLLLIFQRMENQLLDTAARYLNLLLAFVAIVFAIYGVWAGFPWFALRLAIIGALSYFLSFLPGLLLGLITCIIWMEQHSALYPFDVLSAFGIVQGIGTINICWLGYRHALEKRQYMQPHQPKSHQITKNERIVSWQILNDLRSSLAAVRFLLFPGGTNITQRNLDDAMEELARLEQLVGKIVNNKNRMEEKEGDHHETHHSNRDGSMV
ncbi:hypothetical protein [Alicyclobacillus tolerans]|uniref:Uncharacterized protein n=1 Tax=Alicyclobacillus tolerans TaxID=90970 RepID=A0A1M6XZZ3_9BACL|nr:hypothetical protein [Alicyclobacillus montanus]SHL11514.1 hypothetical protein SAMN05443507_1404 [Alicyclobacillus montanus]